MKTVVPVKDGAGMIYFGPNGQNVHCIFGIDADHFLSMHAALSDRGLKVTTYFAEINIRFVLYCDALLSSGADINALIWEFNHAQKGDGTDAYHALSLAMVFYHYHANGYAVRIIPTDNRRSTPDLTIDGMTCELKTRIDQTPLRMKTNIGLLRDGKIDEYHDASMREIKSPQDDLVSAIRNRVYEGLRQADCVILDMSSHFHSWNYYRLASAENDDDITGLYENPVRPVKGACILFSSDNANNLVTSGFTPRAFWGYLPLDSVSP